VARWLLVGALGAETSPLVAALERARPRGLRLVAGRLHGHEVAVLTCGVGPDKAGRRIAAALAAWRPQRVLNLGTCGALVDELAIGDLLHGDRILDDQGHVGATAPLGQPAGAIVTVRAGVWDPQTRATLAARGALACEMEAAAVLRACQAVGLPLAVLKVVSDQAGGAPDAALPARAGDRPGPVDIAIFQARALRLVHQRLVPRLPELLGTAGPASSPEPR